MEFKKNVVELQASIPNQLFEKLEERRLRAIEEDNKMREDTMRKLCSLISYEDMNNVLGNVKPLLRTKMRIVRLMTKFKWNL